MKRRKVKVEDKIKNILFHEKRFKEMRNSITEGNSRAMMIKIEKLLIKLLTENTKRKVYKIKNIIFMTKRRNEF